MQIGTKDDTGIGSADAENAIACLCEYMKGFQKRNPNFHVFNAVMHLDEATPHLHIDYIPVGHFANGLDTRNAIKVQMRSTVGGWLNGKSCIEFAQLTVLKSASQRSPEVTALQHKSTVNTRTRSDGLKKKRLMR